jgi:hypothetical protein
MSTYHLGKSRVGLAVVTLGFLVGCATKTVFLDGRRAFPAEPKFRITPREYSPEELVAAGIRTDGVYVDIGWRPEELQALEEAMFREKGWKTGSPFYRFWSNGRVMGQTAHAESVSAAAADSFDRADLGYFRIVTNGTIEIEQYLYDPGQGAYRCFLERRTIENDTIWSDTGRTHKGEAVQLGYRFVPIEGMTAEPDW